MSYCINPNCKKRQNSDNAENCLFCKTSLLIEGRIRLVKPLRLLPEDPFSYYTEIFEVDDAGTQWNPVREQRIMKVLTLNNPQLLSLFEREAQTLQILLHPGIPRSTIDDYFTFVPTSCSKLHCLVMQKIEGENLAQWIERSGRISQAQALQWLQQLFEILDFVHRSGFFHRDIKPSNIIVQPNSQLALIDFGGVREVTDTYLAKVSGSAGTDTAMGYEITAIRTPCYSPLEQINGRAVPQSDFYAVGRTFVYCLTGIQLINLPANEKTGRLIWRKKAPQIDQPLADFLDELMAPFPAQRPQTTQVILQRLERLPLKSKLNRVIKSKPFIISAAILVLLSAFGICNASLPWVANYFLRQGKEAQLKNRWTDAQKDFQTAVKLNPSITYSVSSFYFEQASRNKERPETAKKYYELAIKFNPQDVDAYKDLALVCHELRDFKCVIGSYRLLQDKKPYLWSGYNGLGSFYDEQGKYDLAEQQYKKAIDNSNQAILSVNNLSRLKNKTGHYEKAIELASHALESAKTPVLKAALYKNLGWARLEQKHYAEAKSALQKSIELDPDRTDAWCLLAQAQEALGEINDSQLSWEVCLIADSNSNLPEVQAWRQKILQRLWDRQNQKLPK